MPKRSVAYLKKNFLAICINRNLNDFRRVIRDINESNIKTILYTLKENIDKKISSFFIDQHYKEMDDSTLDSCWLKLIQEIEQCFLEIDYQQLNPTTIQLIETLKVDLIQLSFFNEFLIRETYVSWLRENIAQELGSVIYNNKYSCDIYYICYSPSRAKEANKLAFYLHLMNINASIDVGKQIGERISIDSSINYDRVILLPDANDDNIKDECLAILGKENGTLFLISQDKNQEKATSSYVRAGDITHYLSHLKFESLLLEILGFTFSDKPNFLTLAKQMFLGYENEVLRMQNQSITQLLTMLKPDDKPTKHIKTNRLLKFYNTPKLGGYSPKYMRLFIDNQKQLDKVHSHLNNPNSPNILACSGLSGTGKSHLVLKYIDLHHNDYQHILWFNAKNREQLYKEFLGLVEQVNGECPKDAPFEALVEFINSWLKDSPSTLVVYDKIVDFSLINELTLPKHTHTLLTTIRNDFPHKLSMKPLSQADSVLFLKEILPDADAYYEEFSLLLKGHPQSLFSLGNFACLNYLSATELSDLIKSSRQEMLNELLAFEPWIKLTDLINPHALIALNICAFIPEQGIPEHILKKLLNNAPNIMQNESCNVVIDTLLKFNALTSIREPSQIRYFMPSILQLFLLNKLSEVDLTAQQKYFQTRINEIEIEEFTNKVNMIKNSSGLWHALCFFPPEISFKIVKNTMEFLTPESQDLIIESIMNPSKR